MGLGPNDRRLSAYHIRRACEASLRRLQTDHIDLYQMHHVDRATPWEEIWQAMEQLVREGKITYVGSSNFAGWDVALAQSAASARHFLGLTSEQSLYNLAVRTVEMELIPALRSLGIGLIPYSPLHAGLLAGVLEAASGGTHLGRLGAGIASRRTATSSKRMKGCAGSWGRSRRPWRWPGCCATRSSPPRSSERRRSRSCGSILGALSVQLGRRGRGTTRPDLAGAGRSPAGVRLVNPVRTACSTGAPRPLGHRQRRHQHHAAANYDQRQQRPAGTAVTIYGCSTSLAATLVTVLCSSPIDNVWTVLMGKSRGGNSCPAAATAMTAVARSIAERLRVVVMPARPRRLERYGWCGGGRWPHGWQGSTGYRRPVVGTLMPCSVSR